MKTIENAELVGSVSDRFVDKIGDADINLNVWDVQMSDGDLITKGGDAVGSSYIRLTKHVANIDESYLLSKEVYHFPVRLTSGQTMSQRLVGQLASVELVGIDSSTGLIDLVPQKADVLISGDITVATNVGTINTVGAHGFRGGDKIHVVNCLDNRLNVGLVAVTVVTPTQITVPITIANATYTVGGAGRLVNHSELNGAKNGIGLVQDTATATSLSMISRRGDQSPKQTTATVLTNAATQLNTSPFTDAFVPASELELIVSNEEAVLYPRSVDALTAAIPVRFNNSLPDESVGYRLRYRMRGLPNLIIPNLKIATASKSGTTTATIVTTTPHNLNTLSWVQIYGCRDITNFPNLVASTQVASIVNEYTFTIVMAGAVTASTTGGTVHFNHGQALQVGIQNVSIQSIARTSNILTVTVNAAMTTPLSGEFYTLYGMDGAAAEYDGAYKVLRYIAAATTMDLESIGPDFGSINCGGSVLKNTDFRIHYARLTDYAQSVVELANARGGQTDNSKSLPVAISGGILPTVTTVTTVSTVTAVTTVAAVTSSNLGIPGIIADIASAALTTTTTTAAVTPTFGSTYTVMMAVTAVTGTTPTLDVQVQESDDTGTNWYAVYDFPRITATGNYRSPRLILSGNRVRYVQTVAGTTPSFTRALNRLQCSTGDSDTFRQLIDRSINVNSLNSVTPTLQCAHGKAVQVVVNVGAITTTAAQFQLEGSDDYATATPTWYAISTPLTCVASSTVASAVVAMSPQALRVRVSTAGSGVTAGWVLFKSF